MEEFEFEPQITLRGPKHENERGYPKRETLAEATLPIQPSRGWEIYLGGLEKAITPIPSLFVPEGD
jgi:hypothetical protein